MGLRPLVPFEVHGQRVGFCVVGHVVWDLMKRQACVVFWSGSRLFSFCLLEYSVFHLQPLDSVVEFLMTGGCLRCNHGV